MYLANKLSPPNSPRLCPCSTTLRHVHHSSQYPHFLLFSKPSPLRRWSHSALSFLPSDSLRLQHRSPSCNDLHRISCWMTANLLTLNSSKTEFLLIGLSKQLAKICLSGFESFDNSTCKRVLDLLEPGDLRLGQVVIKRVAVVKAWSEQRKWRWWKLFWYRGMDGYSEDDE